MYVYTVIPEANCWHEPPPPLKPRRQMAAKCLSLGCFYPLAWIPSVTSRRTDDTKSLPCVCVCVHRGNVYVLCEFAPPPGGVVLPRIYADTGPRSDRSAPGAGERSASCRRLRASDARSRTNVSPFHSIPQISTLGCSGQTGALKHTCVRHERISNAFLKGCVRHFSFFKGFWSFCQS